MTLPTIEMLAYWQNNHIGAVLFFVSNPSVSGGHKHRPVFFGAQVFNILVIMHAQTSCECLGLLLVFGVGFLSWMA